MRKLLALLVTILALTSAAGCGGDGERGKYKDQNTDRPKSPDRDR